MPILAADIKQAMVAQLGVAGTQRYLDQQHYIPSIRGAQRQFVAFINALLADRKGSEELLREVTMTRVFQTNAYGGITMSEAELGHKLWAILGVFPEPLTVPAQPLINALPDDESQVRNDVVMRRPGKFRCTRVSIEQVPDTVRSRFMPGSEKMANSALKTYAYYIVGDRSADGTTFQPEDVELAVLPESITGKKIVVVSYLKGVEEITSLQDNIPFPASAFQILRDLSLNELSVRQGAKPMFQVTIESVQALMRAQS